MSDIDGLEWISSCFKSQKRFKSYPIHTYKLLFGNFKNIEDTSKTPKQPKIIPSSKPYKPKKKQENPIESLKTEEPQKDTKVEKTNSSKIELPKPVENLKPKVTVPEATKVADTIEVKKPKVESDVVDSFKIDSQRFNNQVWYTIGNSKFGIIDSFDTEQEAQQVIDQARNYKFTPYDKKVLQALLRRQDRAYLTNEMVDYGYRDGGYEDHQRIRNEERQLKNSLNVMQVAGLITAHSDRSVRGNRIVRFDYTPRGVAYTFSDQLEKVINGDESATNLLNAIKTGQEGVEFALHDRLLELGHAREANWFDNEFWERRNRYNNDEKNKK